MSEQKQFEIKDSGKRMEFESGMVRDTTEGKIDYSLALDGPMFKRFAIHLTKGAKKYSKRNWLKANGQAELERFRESALRHFLQWYWSEVDEDHAAAIWFNVNCAEYVKNKLGAATIFPPINYKECSEESLKFTLNKTVEMDIPCGQPK